ncbi:low molecular weight protein-tyrosine-phosphatase [Actinobaculum suis]|nr:low molecular weight protein-tyrosine-phosphatase [Actinobaculum suis]MDY5152791.1 low molecular weight protein-tyrosine-phosphatase [Actinobaculum suis]
MTELANQTGDILRRLHERPQILVVCTGNICRSPMGEVVLREKLAQAQLDIRVASAGVSNEEHGRGIYPPAQRALKARGYPTPERAAHRVTQKELAESGLILAMTTGHARALKRLLGAAGLDEGAIHLWREFDGSGLGICPHGVFGPGGVLEPSEDDIPARKRRNSSSDFYYSSGRWDVSDPWGGADAEFEKTLDSVEQGASGIVNLLLAARA